MRTFAGLGGEDLLIPVIESGEPVGHLRQPQDAIAPVSIVHDCDQAFNKDGNLEYHYNYFVYLFDSVAGQLRAKSYVDDIATADLFLPDGMSEADPVVQRVLYYLSRRYRRIRRLGASGYETIWNAAKQSGAA